MKKKITLFGLIMMIFSTIFGFANSPIAFDQMGYASIIWYIIGAIFFFLPVSLMLAEYGSAYKEAKGGIYSWLAESVGEKTAFIGTFIWLASWITWLVSTASKVWIPFSAFLFGRDTTQSWHVFGLSSTETIALLGVLWILVITFFSARGMDSISKISSIGGVFVILLNVVFLVASIVTWIANKGQLMEPINGMSSFIHSPNPQFSSPIAIISFVIYAIFAYAGMETMGGVTDDLEKPEKTFPKALIFSTILITISYSVIIFLWGVSTNWNQLLSGSHVNLGNVTYVMMHNLGVTLGHSLHLSEATSLMLGSLIIRFTGLGMFIGYLGAFFVIVYSPIKSLILGSDKTLWPAKMTKLNKANMPAYTMWVQAIIISIFILLISFGGTSAQKFYVILTDMGNVSTSCPYIFLVAAFPFFKKRTDIERPFEIFKNKLWTNIIVVIVLIVLIASVIFTCLEPVLNHDYDTAFWTVIGPIFFGGVAWIFYAIRERRMKKNAQ
ncbi:glutamate/gamma-aminobutyrate family transporter YjeM [Ligilactobacillus ceti]|uniref:Inner membrane transporter YjeM n=1 Tax=Ligilactobacillus ceti DSM 22408 TaxID=1122146 RepID=A0A0R2KG61_9LACO|nr:glutamate/gamma-aminobutyrate family transporter YjeM [Ligilactobacillus ceti]KRN88402.1 inner membrane transporter YjeM [Ligilactobacillus ceti DSM 22408]